LEFEAQQGQNFSSLRVFHTDSGANQATNPMGKGSSFSGGEEDGM
jgi:hypothetical protein